MNLEGLTEKWSNNPIKSRRLRFYENPDGEVVAKMCSKCNEIKQVSEYSSDKRGFRGLRSDCKTCHAWTKRKWQKEKADSIAERKRIWYENNQEGNAGRTRKWRNSNPEKASLIDQRRRARKKGLLDTLTDSQYAVTLDYFGNACALTGQKHSLEKEHAIPLSIGHGGTTFENCYPMANGLNQSKWQHNIFEWFEANRQRFNLSQERFDRLIEWLGKANGMTVEEYRDYVYWCHANPRNIDEEVNEKCAM